MLNQHCISIEREIVAVEMERLDLMAIRDSRIAKYK